jgi:hypothetical protein
MPDDIVDAWTERLIALLLQIAAAAEQHGRRYFISSGLAVDLAFGGLSRAHEDIDFHPLEADTEWWKEWFVAQGYVIDHDPDMAQFPYAFLVTNAQREYLADVYPMREAADGTVEITHTGDYEGRPWWAGKSWRALRRITYRGQRIVVEPYETALAQKAGHVLWHGGMLDEKHLHDFRRAGMSLDDFMPQ